MKRLLPILTLTLSLMLFASAGFAQQTDKEMPRKQQQMKEMMQDSTMRAMIIEHMAQDPQMRQQMMQQMMGSMANDTSNMTHKMNQNSQMHQQHMDRQQADKQEMRQEMIHQMMGSMEMDTTMMMENMEQIKNDPQMKERMEKHIEMLQSMLDNEEISNTQMEEMMEDSSLMKMHMMYMQMVLRDDNADRNRMRNMEMDVRTGIRYHDQDRK
jgi:hypothetical protein